MGSSGSRRLGLPPGGSLRDRGARDTRGQCSTAAHSALAPAERGAPLVPLTCTAPPSHPAPVPSLHPSSVCSSHNPRSFWVPKYLHLSQGGPIFLNDY